MAFVEVFENQPFTHLQGDELAFLRRRLGARLQRRADAWVIMRLVGRIAFPNGRVLRIRSGKAPTASLLAWLAYADRSLRALRDTPLPESSDGGDVFASLASLYVEALLHACTQNGLVRAYRPMDVRSSCVRGRINFPRLLADGHNLARIPCVTWAREIDTPLNRFLAAAIAQISGDVLLRDELRGPLRAITRWFEGVPATVTPGLLRGHVLLGRSESVFQAAFELARCILLHSGVNDGHRLSGHSFLIDLEQYFERVVLRAFQDADVSCEEKPPLSYSVRRGADETYRSMAPDLCCRLPDGPLIVDAKFTHTLSSGNIQQIVTYCVLTGARRAVFVVPEGGDVDDAYLLPFPDGQDIEIRVVRLNTLGSTVANWRANAARMVRDAIRTGVAGQGGSATFAEGSEEVRA